MPPFYLEDDLVVSPSGTFREATLEESVRQDIAHMLEEVEAIAEPATQVFVDDVRSQILALLGEHPGVRSIDGVTVAANDTNSVDVSVRINGNPGDIVLTGIGGT